MMMWLMCRKNFEAIRYSSCDYVFCNQCSIRVHLLSRCLAVKLSTKETKEVTRY